VRRRSKWSSRLHRGSGRSCLRGGRWLLRARASIGGRCVSTRGPHAHDGRRVLPMGHGPNGQISSRQSGLNGCPTVRRIRSCHLTRSLADNTNHYGEDEQAAFRAKRRSGEDARYRCLRNRAAIPHVSCNDFRRTFATSLGDGAQPEMVTASRMGHASTAMVRRVYTKIGSAAQQRAVAALPSMPVLNAARAVAAGVAGPVRNPGSSGRPGRPGSQSSSEVVVPRDGVEPPTRGFSVPCSTN